MEKGHKSEIVALLPDETARSEVLVLLQDLWLRPMARFCRYIDWPFVPTQKLFLRHDEIQGDEGVLQFFQKGSMRSVGVDGPTPFQFGDLVEGPYFGRNCQASLKSEKTGSLSHWRVPPGIGYGRTSEKNLHPGQRALLVARNIERHQCRILPPWHTDQLHSHGFWTSFRLPPSTTRGRRSIVVEGVPCP